MSEENSEERPEVKQVTTEFDGGIVVRSGFSIERQEPGVLGINLFGPIFEFNDEEDAPKVDEDEDPECPDL